MFYVAFNFHDQWYVVRCNFRSKFWHCLKDFGTLLFVYYGFVTSAFSVTVNSLIEDGLVFNFWIFEAVFYSNIFQFSIFYSRQSFIRNSLLLKSLRYLLVSLGSFRLISYLSRAISFDPRLRESKTRQGDIPRNTGTINYSQLTVQSIGHMSFSE